jgi:hypothetical protein
VLSFILGLVGTYRLGAARFGRLGRVGLVVAVLGYALFLVGNVVEFGLIGALWREEGWAIVLAALLVIPFGMLLFGVAAGRASGLAQPSGTAMLVFGLVLASAILLGIVEMIACACARADRALWLLVVGVGVGWIAQGYLLSTERAHLPSRSGNGPGNPRRRSPPTRPA